MACTRPPPASSRPSPPMACTKLSHAATFISAASAPGSIVACTRLSDAPATAATAISAASARSADRLLVRFRLRISVTCAIGPLGPNHTRNARRVRFSVAPAPPPPPRASRDCRLAPKVRRWPRRRCNWRCTGVADGGAEDDGEDAPEHSSTGKVGRVDAAAQRSLPTGSATAPPLLRPLVRESSRRSARRKSHSAPLLSFQFQKNHPCEASS
mmetsp:Transcript_12026/g.34651  ORF Transcript_12026/g.34651 Transcript_12026/m.34651 type:complete len:213 (+) Transcript_12026:224-862(+)